MVFFAMQYCTAVRLTPENLKKRLSAGPAQVRLGPAAAHATRRGWTRGGPGPKAGGLGREGLGALFVGVDVVSLTARRSASGSQPWQLPAEQLGTTSAEIRLRLVSALKEPTLLAVLAQASRVPVYVPETAFITWTDT